MSRPSIVLCYWISIHPSWEEKRDVSGSKILFLLFLYLFYLSLFHFFHISVSWYWPLFSLSLSFYYILRHLLFLRQFACPSSVDLFSSAFYSADIFSLPLYQSSFLLLPCLSLLSERKHGDTDVTRRPGSVDSPAQLPARQSCWWKPRVRGISKSINRIPSLMRFRR